MCAFGVDEAEKAMERKENKEKEESERGRMVKDTGNRK